MYHPGPQAFLRTMGYPGVSFHPENSMETYTLPCVKQIASELSAKVPRIPLSEAESRRGQHSEEDPTEAKDSGKLS